MVYKQVRGSVGGLSVSNVNIDIAANCDHWGPNSFAEMKTTVGCLCSLMDQIVN